MKNQKKLLTIIFFINFISSCGSFPQADYAAEVNGNGQVREVEKYSSDRAAGTMPSGSQYVLIPNKSSQDGALDLGSRPDLAARQTLPSASDFSKISSDGRSTGDASEPSYDVSFDSSGLSSEELFTRLAQDVLQRPIYIEADESLAESAPSVSFKGPVSENFILRVLKQAAKELGKGIAFVDGSVFVGNGPLQSEDIGVAIGIGSALESVPRGLDQVIQIVPVENDWNLEIDKIVAQFSGVTLSRSNSLNAYVLRGNREAIIRALKVINTLDMPAIRGREVRFSPVKFFSPTEASNEIVRILAAEGIQATTVGGRVSSSAEGSLFLVPVPRLGGIVMFSAHLSPIRRAEYWLDMLDQPEKRADEGVFVYVPRNLGGDDLLDSARMVFGSPAPKAKTPAESTAPGEVDPSTRQAPSRQSAAFNGENFSMAYDLNSGNIYIRSSAEEFSRIEEVLKKLDIPPKQILLEVVIAEISLKGEFRFGFEWALKNRGIEYSTLGAFGGGSFSGLSVSLSKDKILSGRIFASDSRINVLSSPSLLVRVGEKAVVSIGSRISVVGQTTFDPLVGGQRQTTAAEYLSTGVDVSFSTNLIGSDVIDISIDQSISNTVAGSSGAAGNPDIFDRSLQTRALAKSGQTIMLGGLISERSSGDSTGLPFLSKVPIAGALFGTQGRQRDRTELVMLVTPRVFQGPDSWGDSFEEFQNKLEALPALSSMLEDASSLERESRP